MATDRDTQKLLDCIEEASDSLTPLTLTGSEARALNYHLYDLNEIRGEVGDLRDKLARARLEDPNARTRALNAIAHIVQSDTHEFQPLSVRYGIAEAVLEVLAPLPKEATDGR